MSNVIEILAGAGETGRVDTQALAPDLSTALANGDRAAIARLIGLTGVYACMVVAPENEPDAPAEQQPEEDEPQPDSNAA